MDSKDNRQRKRNVSDHFFIDSVTALGDNTFKITVEKSYAPQLGGVANGDIFAMPVHNFKDNEKNNFTPNVAVSNSADIAVENITLYRNRNSMCFWICGNRGKVTMKGNKITWLPDSQDVIATWRDGYHCKSNKVGPTIENCRCEGLLDDSINISTDTIMISKVINSKTFELSHYGFKVGDEMGLLFMDTGKWIDGVKIVSQKGRIVEVDKPIDGIKIGLKRTHTDKDSTQVYNMAKVNKNFKIKNCYFGKQRRNAMLIRAFSGKIEGNIAEDVTANCVFLGNETGWFYEGPFPRNITIKNNTFKNSWGPAISVLSHTFSKNPLGVECGVKILKNTFVKDSSARYPSIIYLFAMRGIRIKENTFKTSGSEIIPPERAIQINNCEDIEVEQD